MPSPIDPFIRQVSTQTSIQESGNSQPKSGRVSVPQSQSMVLNSGARVSEAATRHLASQLSSGVEENQSNHNLAGSFKAKTFHNFFRDFRIDSNIRPDDNFV